GFGLALLEQGRAADARNVFERMETLFPGDPTVHTLLAHAAARLPDPRRADIRRGLEAARFAVESDPGSAEAWHALSLLRHLDGDYEAALEAARQSLALDARQPAGPETTERYQQQETACHDALLVFSPLD
ncbi:MAG TPA: tetratricopeptide repeat protein, partial [Kiritimatiellia bacterium]|nr:tetratricopeptide repeat protein [Kiritimatiellia bacterium]